MIGPYTTAGAYLAIAGKKLVCERKSMNCLDHDGDYRKYKES